MIRNNSRSKSFPLPAKYKAEFEWLKEVEIVIGLDVSYWDKKADYTKFYREMLDRLAKAQRVFSRRTKGSIRWNKQRIRVATLHEKVANQGKNFLHRKSKELATHFDVVAIAKYERNVTSTSFWKKCR